MVAAGIPIRGGVRRSALLAVRWLGCGEVASLRLITWNLNARLRQLPDQLAALAARKPDIIALQEVTRGRLETLHAGLAAVGFPRVVDSFSVAPPWEAVGPRRYGLVISDSTTPSVRERLSSSVASISTSCASTA